MKSWQGSMSACLVLIAVSIVVAQELPKAELSPKEQASVEGTIREMISTDTKLVANDAVEKVFGRLAATRLEFRKASGVTHRIELKFVLKDETAVEVDRDKLASAVKETFLLKDDASAKDFEAALDAMYPIRAGDVKLKAIERDDEKWIFVRGDFADDKKGFIVTTDKTGKITDVDYTLRIRKKK